MKFREYRPSYFSGFDNKEYNVESLKDVFEIEFVKNFSKDPNFHCYALADEDKLMGLYKYDKEVGKCSEWWVIGFLSGFQKIDLPKYEELIFRKEILK